jgi:effector-binding domain-containing protein
VGALRGGSAPTRPPPATDEWGPVDRLTSMGNAPRMEPTLVDVEAATTAVIGAVVPRQELVNFFDRSFSSVAAVLSDQDLAIQSPAFARFHRPPAEDVDLEVGFVTASPVRPVGEVRTGSLPRGRVARLVHEGGYDQLGESWGRLGSWIGAQGLTPGRALWEVYVTEPSPEMDPAALRTELNWSIED